MNKYGNSHLLNYRFMKKLNKYQTQSKNIFKISNVLKFINLVLIILIIIYSIRIVLSPIEFSKFEISETMKAKGYNSQVIICKISDNINKINQSMRTQHVFKNKLMNLDLSPPNIPEMALPETGITLRSLIDVIKSYFPDYFTTISGEIVNNDDTNELTIRIQNNKKALSETWKIQGNSSSIDSFLQNAAEFIAKDLEPSTLASYYFLTNNPRTEEIIKYCIANEPKYDDYFVYNLWGCELIINDHPEEAIEKFKKAVEIKKDYTSAYMNWGFALFEMKRFDEAIKSIELAIKYDKNKIAAYNFVGSIYLMKNKYEYAANFYLKALRINKNHIYANYGYASTLFGQKKYDSAIISYRSATKERPFNAGFNSSLADAYRMIGDTSNAIRYYEDALIADSTFCPAAIIYAELLNALGKFSESISLLEGIKTNLPYEIKTKTLHGIDFLFWNLSESDQRAYYNFVLGSAYLGNSNLKLGRNILDKAYDESPKSRYGRQAKRLIDSLFNSPTN